MTMTSAIDYEALVEAFEEALVTKLRGHGAEADYLEMWVPDEHTCSRLAVLPVTSSKVWDLPAPTEAVT